jgi:hypothetical protein
MNPTQHSHDPVTEDEAWEDDAPNPPEETNE